MEPIAVFTAADGRQRVAVTNLCVPAARVDLKSRKDVLPGEGYGAEQSERVEWVLNDGQTLYAVAAGELTLDDLQVEAIDPRGPKG